MTRNRFLKITGLKGLHRRRIKPYLDLVAHYKGKLSYLQLLIFGEVCFSNGRYGLTYLKGFIDEILKEEKGTTNDKREIYSNSL